MNSNAHDQRIEELFAPAKDLSPDEQVTFLNDACRDDPPEVRQAVERLLAADRRQVALRRLAEAPQQAGAVRLNCPHCQNPIELVVDQQEEVVCPSCGSSFHLDAGRTQTWSKDKLPTLGKFSLLSRLGFGAFGTVYKAFDSELKRTVALKIPRSGTLAGAEDEDRFLREARNAAQLRHSGIVPVFEVGRSEQFPYIVSELVEGITLADALSGRRFGFREAAQLVRQLAEALEYSHKQGVVHRDLKPSNIMLSAHDTPRIMDFGLAKREAGEITMTMDGQVLGTPAYMSPEQAAGKAHEVDGRSDEYSLGVIFFELLTGELPFRGNPRMLLHQVLHNEPRTLRSLNDRVPRDLETICLKAMAKEPKRRYQTAGEFGDDLSRYLNGEPILARPVGRVERTWRWCKRQPVVSSLLAAVVLSLAGGIAVSTVYAIRANEREEEALAEWDRAEREKARARERESDALKQLSRAEWLAYAIQIASSQRAFEYKDIAVAWEYLNSCREDLRGWEHDYLYTLFLDMLFTRNQTTFKGDTDPMARVAFSDDGTRIIGCSVNNTLHIWDAMSGDETFTRKGPDVQLASIDFTGDGTRIVTGTTENTLKVWYATTDHTLTLKGHTELVPAAAFGPDGQQIVSGSYDNTLKVWDATSGNEIRTLKGHTGPIRSVAFWPDGNRVVSCSEDGTVKVWDAKSGQAVLTMSARVASVAVNLKTNRIVGGCWDGTLKVWDATNGEEKLTLRGHQGPVLSVAFSPDGKRLVSGSSERAVKVWETTSGQQTCTLTTGETVNSLSFSPDGKRVVSGSIGSPFPKTAVTAKLLRVWDGTAKMPVGARYGSVLFAEIKGAKEELSFLERQLAQYKIDLGQYPSDLTAMRIFPHELPHSNKWRGPYIPDELLLDPWGATYQYKPLGGHKKDKPDIWSLGPDRINGTDDDITNWR